MKKNILQQVGNREEQYTVIVIDTPEMPEEVIPAVTHEEVIVDVPESVDELTGEVIPAVTRTVTIIDEPERVIEAVPAITHEEIRTRLIPIMQAVTVDMAPDEEAAMLADMPQEPEPVAEDTSRLDDIEAALMELAAILGGDA